MSRNIIETVMGGVVLVVAGLFLVFAYASTNVRQNGGYELTARFDRIDGIAVGSDVRIAGVKVGSIVGQRLDPETYLAEVRMSITPDLQVPSDTVAVVTSEGFLGGRFLSLEPGGADDMLPAGGTITYTQSSPGLEQLLGQVIYGLQNQGENQNPSGAESP